MMTLSSYFSSRFSAIFFASARGPIQTASKADIEDIETELFLDAVYFAGIARQWERCARLVRAVVITY